MLDEPEVDPPPPEVDPPPPGDDVAQPMASADPGVVAVSVTISGGRRVFIVTGGLKISHVELTILNAVSAFPVDGQFELPRALWQRMGFQRIFAIPEIIMVKGTDRSTIPGVCQYDPQAGRLLLHDLLGAAVPGATIGVNGSLRCLVMGI
jgi:hypothetical protein